MKHSRSNACLILQRLILLFVYIVIEYYIFSYFIFPYFNQVHGRRKFGIFFVSFWTFISVVWLKSYFHVSWFDAGSVSKEYKELAKISAFDIEQRLSNLPKCTKCNSPQLYGTYHCNKCNMCYYHYDHHCDVVGNCIAYKNTQPFALYLIYGCFILFFTSFALLFPHFFHSPCEQMLTRPFGILVALFAISLSFFAYSTLSNLLSSQSNLEAIYRAKIGHYGEREDLTPYWGDSILLYILPHPPSTYLYKKATFQERLDAFERIH